MPQKALLIFLLCTQLLSVRAQLPKVDQKSSFEFIENKGQFHPLVKYKTLIPFGNIYFEEGSFLYELYNQQDYHLNKDFRHNNPAQPIPKQVRKHAVRFRFIGAKNASSIINLGKKEHYYNYIIDNQRIGNVRPSSSIIYKNIYPGVDYEIFAKNEVKYQWRIEQPTISRLNQIKVAIDGATQINIKDGNLEVKTSCGTISEQAPYAYQLIDGQRTEVKCRFNVLGNILNYKFLEDVNPQHPLVIDPKLIFSTYSGSVGDNFGFTATYDSRGNLYAGGIVEASSREYPVTAGAYDTTYNGGTGTFPANLPCDIAISKYDSSGSKLLWATYIGGNRDEFPHSLVVDKNDDLLIFGTTYSVNYPTTSKAYDKSHEGGTDIVISKISANGSTLMGSTFIGGPQNDGLNQSSALRHNYADDFRGDIITDDDGHIFVATCTLSDSLPTVDSIQGGNEGSTDGYLFELTPNCENLVWATYLGGRLSDALYSVKVDENNIYFGGGAASADLPTSDSVIAEKRVGDVDGIIGYFSKKDKKLKRLSYWGTPFYDQIYFIDIDASSCIYATGQTEGNIAKSAGTYGEDGMGQFIFRIDTFLAANDLVTTFGNTFNAINLAPSAFLVDVCEHIYFSGWGSVVRADLNPGSTTGLEVTGDAEQKTTDDNDFYVMVLDKDAQGLLYATYFGGDVTQDHVDGGTSRFDKRGVIYQSVCGSCPPSTDGQSTQVSDFPTSPDAVFKTNPSVRCSNASFKIDLQIKTAVFADFTATPVVGCTPLDVQFTNKSILGDSLLWEFGDVTTSSEINPSHKYKDAGLYNVKLTVIDSNTCNISSTYDRPIVVIDSTYAELAASYEACTGELTIENLSQEGLDYFWDFGDGNTSIEETPEHRYADSGTYTIKLYTNKGTLCESVDSQTLEISDFARPEIVLYNIFTPDSDGKNDCFKMDGTNLTCSDFELKIYNRWGEKVFQTRDANECWNGKVNNRGKELPSSTYYYVLKYGNTNQTIGDISGIIELVR